MSQTPRWWLSAGAGVFLLSILVGYHQDQVAADSVLNGKIGVPPIVRMQDYDASMHSNLLQEVQVLGEVAIDHAVVVDLGTDGASRPVHVVPVYPVSSESMPMAFWYLRSVYDATRRPMPRDAAPVLAAESERLEKRERKPSALLISEGKFAEKLAVVGEGMNGPLVAIFGAETGGGEIALAAGDLLAERGVDLSEDAQVIALYDGGKRPETPVKDFSAFRRLLEMVALALFGFGALQAFNPFIFWRQRQTEVQFEEVQAVGEFPGVYAPMQGHEDSIRQAQDASERRAATTRRARSRMV